MGWAGAGVLAGQAVVLLALSAFMLWRFQCTVAQPLAAADQLMTEIAGCDLAHTQTPVEGNSPVERLLERMQRVAQDFQQQHQADQKLKDADRKGYTLLLAMRDWEFAAFAPMRR